MGLTKIDKKAASLTGVVYHRLREAILSGDLMPNQTLVEEQLAENLGVSRSPLREALAKLEHEGLVESIPYRGTIVASTTRAEVIQIMQIRQRMEALAIELAIEAIPEAEIERVVACIRDRRPLLEHGDLMAHFECNREFHGLARRHSGNALLEQILGSLEEKADTYRRAAAKESNIVEELLISMEEHLDVLEMYRKRDLQGALTMMDRHLVMTCERLGAKLRPLVGSARKPDS